MTNNDRLEKLFDKLQELTEKERDDRSLIPERYSIEYDYKDPDGFMKWLAKLPSHAREKAETLLGILRELKARNPESWVISEINEDIAQLSRFLILRYIELEIMTLPKTKIEKAERNPESNPTLTRLLQSGVSTSDLREFAENVLDSAIFDFLNLLDGTFPSATENAPNCVLMETDANGRLTGRIVDGLHESSEVIAKEDSEE